MTRDHFILLTLTLLALGLRLWQLDSVPPGWRDDELINSLVISQKVLDGDWQLYYPDASGHEALYHALNALFLAAFGATVPGIRWLSVLLGTAAVPLTYLVGKLLFQSRWVGVVAALGLAFSFWGLMYSRIGLRHVSLPFFMLIAFYFFLRPFFQEAEGERVKTAWLSFGLSAVFLGLSFYTYFASRGVPLIIIAWLIYAAIVAWPRVRAQWRGVVGLGLLTAVFALPLALTLQQQPEPDARVLELAAPIINAREGDFALLQEHIIRTLNMFHSDGDDEWLYNIPFRPVFGSVGAVFFWLGVLFSFSYAWRPFWARMRGTALPEPEMRVGLASAFLLLWWLAGISPGFLSIPPGSLGHTIVAQSAVYLFTAVPLLTLQNYLTDRARHRTESTSSLPPFLSSSLPLLLLATLLIGSIALRDIPAYFVEWPNRGNVRLLYRADLGSVARYVQSESGLTDFGVTSLLPGPWDRVALGMELGEDTAVFPRLYNPERVILFQPAQSFIGYPVTLQPIYADWYEAHGPRTGGYTLSTVTNQPLPADFTTHNICFVNGFCLRMSHFDPATGQLDLLWHVAEPLTLPPMPLISNPPPPGVDARPRLQFFAQQLDTTGNWLAGDDGLWIDVQTLRQGDLFIQRHYLPPLTEAVHDLRIGQYDPVLDERILTKEGADSIPLPLNPAP